MNKTAQQTVEYAIVLGVLAMVLTGMYVYIKRGVQATIKHSADQFGSGSQRGKSITDTSSSSTTVETTANVDTSRENMGSKRIDYGESTTTDIASTSVSITDY